MRGTLLRLGVVVSSLIVLAVPDSGASFGTIHERIFFGQRSEHERITRAALTCRAIRTLPSCFESRTLDELAGVTWRFKLDLTLIEWGTFGAVGIPDMWVPLVEGEEAHCDNADYFAGGSYTAKARRKADAAFMACRSYIKERVEEAVTAAGKLVEPGPGGVARIARDQIDLTNRCIYVPRSFQGGRKKCGALKGIGRALHAVHDFYSHSNWADEADPRRSVGIDNPPGLNRTDRPTLLAFLLPDSAVSIPSTLTTGCFEYLELADVRYSCKGRIRHKDLAKDKGLIDLDTGTTEDPSESRGKVRSNFQKAVRGAVAESRRFWNDFRERLVQRYKQPRADVLICTLVRDDPVTWCERHVPKLIGELLSTATKSIRDSGLRVRVLEQKCVSPSAPGDTRRRVASQSPAPGTLVVRNAEVTVTVCTSGTPAPTGWTGDWRWKATRTDTDGVFVASTPMSIVQQGQTVCAVWSFSGGGSAKGGLSGRTWGNASWYDGFGKGAWTLTLAADGKSFTGSQTIDPHGAGALNFAAKIVGTRLSSSSSTALDCKTLKVGS